jgi:hypothetical protein
MFSECGEFYLTLLYVNGLAWDRALMKCVTWLFSCFRIVARIPMCIVKQVDTHRLIRICISRLSFYVVTQGGLFGGVTDWGSIPRIGKRLFSSPQSLPTLGPEYKVHHPHVAHETAHSSSKWDSRATRQLGYKRTFLFFKILYPQKNLVLLIFS